MSSIQAKRSHDNRGGAETFGGAYGGIVKQRTVPHPEGTVGANVLWSEVVGLNEPMEEVDRLLGDETVETIVSNLRDMEAQQRTRVIAERVPFRGAFLVELMRTINMATSQQEHEPTVVEDDDSALLQMDVRGGGGRQAGDAQSLMQVSVDPAIPFGSKLAQLQARLNSMDEVQCITPTNYDIQT